MMQTLPHHFVHFALEQNVLQFGNFTLKSGRQSPYFFNAGLFYQGNQLARLGEFYAQTLLAKAPSFDVLFGPAYKGLPLATATAIALAHQGSNIEVTFNRKEAKGHGEKGLLIGAPLKNKRIVIIDDVITAGTAFRESQQLIEHAGGELVGVIIALDRQEKGSTDCSAIQEIEQIYHIPVMSIICLQDIIDYLYEQQQDQAIKAIEAYQRASRNS